jgi:hypothetical protein
MTSPGAIRFRLLKPNATRSLLLAGDPVLVAVEPTVV